VHTRDHLFLEDRAGAYILLGNAEMARITLDEWLTAMKNGFRETNRSFFRDGEIRASMLKRMYLSQGLAKAQEHLNGCVSIMKAFFSTE
jgi:hypothetical protein